MACLDLRGTPRPSRRSKSTCKPHRCCSPPSCGAINVTRRRRLPGAVDHLHGHHTDVGQRSAVLLPSPVIRQRSRLPPRAHPALRSPLALDGHPLCRRSSGGASAPAGGARSAGDPPIEIAVSRVRAPWRPPARRNFGRRARNRTGRLEPCWAPVDERRILDDDRSHDFAPGVPAPGRGRHGRGLSRWDLRLHRPVALCSARRRSWNRGSAPAPALRARLGADHPNIAVIYDRRRRARRQAPGVPGDGYVPGRTRRGEALKPSVGAAELSSRSDALRQAHERGIVHHTSNPRTRS